ncbi:MAG: heavy metal translocating P-type ATPase [Candidatus Kariarchaeaceae archaeon]|jgi:Cd2+/Zn2+-exporting ATPase
MTQALQVEESQSIIQCNCGDDGCVGITITSSNQQFSWNVLFRNLMSNDRFQFLLISMGIALIGLIIDLTVDFDQLYLIWWLAALVGLVIPLKLSIRSLKKGNLTINTLLTIATISALLLQLYEEAVLLVIIFSMGEILESVLVKVMEGGLEGLKSLVPTSATIVYTDDSMEVVAADTIEKGQTLLIRTGDIVPVDSRVIESTIEVEQAHLTGESDIVSILTGEIVFAGSSVVRGSSKVEAIVNSYDSQVHHIVKSVEEALQRKSGAERFSERFGRWYTPFVFALAIVIAFIIPLFTSQSYEDWILRALVILVVSCACGLAVSVPVTVVSSVSSAAKRGILIRGGASIEKMGKIRAIIFDKTGTLTIGKPTVKVIKLFSNYNENQVQAFLKTLVLRSHHPISKSISQYLDENDIRNSFKISNFEEIAGSGIIGTIDGHVIEVMRDVEQKYSQEVIAQHGTSVSYSVIRLDGEDVGYIILQDELRDEAYETVQELKQMDMHIVLLTGDNQAVAQDVAEKLGITEYYAQVLPSQKVEAMRSIKEKYGFVAMVGDGINDAPVLADADVGFAMGDSGAEIASDVADIVLMHDNLMKIPQTIVHGKRAFRIAEINIGLSLFTVFMLLLLAGLGILDLVSGIIANEATALLIIANGLRMMRFTD